MKAPLLSASEDASMGTAEVSTELLELQQEWCDLLRKEELELMLPPPSTLGTKDKELLAGLWFDDGTLGVTIDYPRSQFELYCYYLTRSRYNIMVYTAITALQICLPFCEPPSCPWTVYKNNESIDMNYTDNGRYMSLHTSRVLSLICILIYCLDVVLRLIVNRRRSATPGYKSKWVLFRMLCCIAMLVETIVFFVDDNPFRFTRCLVPMLYITRRHSLRKMAHGLMISFSRTLNIQLLQVAVLILWAFAGFMLFHNIPLESGSRFDTISESFLTVLHAITSRSYNMLRLSDYYAHSTVTAVFFVGLTLAGDLICTNLIIAVGNRQYRLFGIRTFRRQLKNRRQAMIAIHEILSDDEGHITRSRWTGFCSNINGKYSVHENFANMLFNLECFSVVSGSTGGDDVIDCEGLFKLCALLSARVRVLGVIPAPSPVQAVAVDPNAPSDKSQLSHLSRQMSVSKLIPRTGVDSDGESDDDDLPSLMMQEGCSDKNDAVGILASESTTVVDRRNWRSHSKSRREFPEDSSQPPTLINRLRDLRVMGRDLVSYSYPLHAAFSCLEPYQTPASASASDNPSRTRKWLHWMATIQICPWSVFFMLLRNALFIQLLFYSTSNRPQWIYVGWALEALFWVEMLVLLSLQGLTKYLKRNGYGYVMLLNVTSLVVILLIGTSSRHDGYKYYCLMIVQICRFFRFSRFLKGFKTFYAITPLILRVFFIIFAIIYIFADFAHNRMCSTLNPDNIQDEDDDSEQWLAYQHVLNFRTYLQSVLTLYEVATLGNWSPIMGAAAQTDPVLSLLFFYTYRLTMTLAVFPLLFAFIIQAFITKRDLESQSKKDTTSATRTGGDDGGHSGVPTTQNSSKFRDKVDSDRGFKYRRQLYGELLVMESREGSKCLRDQLDSSYVKQSEGDIAHFPAPEKSFSAHTFEYHDRAGHANSLQPLNDVIFTDIGSPLASAVPRQQRSHPSSPRATLGGTPDRRYKVEKEVDKGTSMMAFWAQGEKTTSDAQKDKDRAAQLQRKFEAVSELLAAERRRTQEQDSRYQELLQKYEEQSFRHQVQSQPSTTSTDDASQKKELT